MYIDNINKVLKNPTGGRKEYYLTNLCSNSKYLVIIFIRTPLTVLALIYYYLRLYMRYNRSATFLQHKYVFELRSSNVECMQFSHDRLTVVLVKWFLIDDFIKNKSITLKPDLFTAKLGLLNSWPNVIFQ